MELSIIIAIAGILVSIIVTVFVTMFFTSRKKLKYFIDTHCFNLKKYDVKGLQIKYEENDIDTLSITKLLLKNIGNRTINQDDIALNDKLCISVNESSHIFYWKVLNSDTANNIRVEQIDSYKCCIEFDYLDQKDYAQLVFYHNFEAEPKFTGKIKGCKIIKNNLIYNKKLYFLLTCATFLIMLPILIFVSENYITPLSWLSLIPIGILGFLAGVFAFMYLRTVAISNYRKRFLNIEDLEIQLKPVLIQRTYSIKHIYDKGR